MLEYNSNILKSEDGIIYVDNIKAVKDISKTFLKPNNILVSSYNYNIFKNYTRYKGTSYELYYVDNNSNIRQLSYYVNEGNGLYIDDEYNLGLNIDNKTIKENESHELYIDSNELTCAYNHMHKGVLAGENKLFYDHLLNNSGFIVSTDGILKLSNGLLMSLYEIKNYYDQFDKLALDINKIAVKLDFKVDVFNVGDILYIDENSKYTKVAEGNMPFMICVIASNTLSDGAARFIPINFNNSKSIFARNNNNLYYKKLFSHIPVYDNNLNMLSSSSGITSSTYGFMASDNSQWVDNFKNPFNYKEHYYANLYTMKTDIVWYLDPDTFHKQDMYSLDAKSIVTEIINLDQFGENKEISPIIEIEFSDGFKGYYMLVFKYSEENKRFELSESALPTEYPLILVNRMNTTIENTTNIAISSVNKKIKVYNKDILVSSKELLNKFQVFQTVDTASKRKFENDNVDSIDYKILVNELKNKKQSTTTASTSSVTKSRVVKDSVDNTTVTYREVLEEINDDDLYETQVVVNEDGSKSYTYKKREPKTTLVPVYNTTTTYIDRTEYYNEEVTNYTTVTSTVYTYKLIMDSGICDRAYAYLLVQLGDNDKNVGKEMYLKYDSSTGLEYVFTQYQSLSSTGYIKIIAYASSEYNDKEPINLGIISVNGYQDSFKVIYLSRDKFSFSFNISSIIPVKAKVYKNYTILSLSDEATILESNNYDDFADAYEYSLDLNYYTITSEVNTSFSEKSSESEEIITYGKKRIIESTISPKETITGTKTIVKMEELPTDSTNNIVKKTTVQVGNASENVVVIDKTVKNDTVVEQTEEVVDNTTEDTTSTTTEDTTSTTTEDQSFTETSNVEDEIQEVVDEIKTETGTTIYRPRIIYPLWWLRHHRYRIIPGAIRIWLKHLPRFRYDFINNIYYGYILVRNGYGKSTFNRYKFIRKDLYLELAEDIPVSDIENINQISIQSIQDGDGNTLDIKLRDTGELINQTTDWEDLNRKTTTVTLQTNTKGFGLSGGGGGGGSIAKVQDLALRTVDMLHEESSSRNLLYQELR